jgi:uncharacterized metal-binding protein
VPARPASWLDFGFFVNHLGIAYFVLAGALFSLFLLSLTLFYLSISLAAEMNIEEI